MGYCSNRPTSNDPRDPLDGSEREDPILDFFRKERAREMATCFWCEKPLSYVGAARLKVMTPKGEKAMCSQRCIDSMRDAADKAIEAMKPESREKVR